MEFSIITIKSDSFFKPYSSSEILDLSSIFKTQVLSASESMVPPLAGASDMFIYHDQFPTASLSRTSSVRSLVACFLVILVDKISGYKRSTSSDCSS